MRKSETAAGPTRSCLPDVSMSGCLHCSVFLCHNSPYMGRVTWGAVYFTVVPDVHDLRISKYFNVMPSCDAQLQSSPCQGYRFHDLASDLNSHPLGSQAIQRKPVQ